MGGTVTVAEMVAKLGLDTSKFVRGTSDTEKAAEKMSSSTTSAFSKLGSGAEKAFTAMIAKAQVAVEVLKKIGQAVKQIVWDELIKGSYTAFAEFQQLSGGAELMFGEAYQWVEDRASEAYKTMQMSKNDYLKQVNGLATGLKTALNGDEMAAAELADRVLTAEADVVAATGNSQEAVQNAFNGIMKSNYTMLDNLQLGIKPTKEGFQELIDQVNAWNKKNGEATNYQIDNLADAQAALVDYIEMQGLAGYAAMEGADTIEGAAASMRAAWENVKLAIGGGDDIGRAMEGLGETVKNWINNAAPQFATVIANIGRTMVDGVPRIMGDIGSAISDNFPKIAAGVGILLLKLTQLVLKAIGKLMQSIANGVLKLGTWLKGRIEAIKNYDWKGLAQSIWEKISTTVSNGWNKLTDNLRTGIGNLLQKAENWINDKLNGAINGIVDGLPDWFKEMFGITGSNIKVSLGSEALLNGKEGAKGAEDPTIAELKKINRSVVESENRTVNALSWFEDAENYLDGIINAECGTTSQVKTQGEAVVDAVTPKEVAEGDSLYDQIKEDMQEWYKSYAAGNWDKTIIDKMQKHLDILQSRGIYVANYDILNSGIIDPAVAEIMKSMPRVPDNLARDESVKGVEGEIAQLELDPTLEVPEGVQDLVTKINTLTAQYEAANTEEERTALVSQITNAIAALNIAAPDIDTGPIVDAISGITVETPEANVNVDVDTSSLNTAAEALGSSENGAATALSKAAENMQSSSLTVQFTAGNLDQQASEEEFAAYMAKNTGMVIDVPIEEVFGAADAFTAVPQDIIDSYYDLSIAISGAAAAIVGYDMTGSGNGGDEGNSGLTGAFTTLKGLINKTYAESKRLGDYWASGFITSIDTMLQYVCMTSTDEEGNVDASGGNTLVTAMGVVFDLFGDILNTSTQLAEHWKGDFIATSKLMRTEAGYASGDLQTLAGDADATAQKFATLAANIQSVTSALAELEGKPNAGLADDAIEAAKALGAGAKKGGGFPGRAAGGPVRAGDSYIVGERGPEFFTPRRSGYIIPNEELGSGNRPEITVNVGNVYGESYLKDKVVEIMTGAIRKEMRLAA